MSEEMLKCEFCGEYVVSDSIKCPYCDEFLKADATQEEYEIQQELKKFNWGACLLHFIWGCGNRTYIAICIIPLFLLLRSLAPWFAGYLGIMGNRLAWEKGNWKNLEHFKNVQKKWSQAGVIVIVSLSIIYLIGMIIFGYYMAMMAAQEALRGY